LVYCYNGVGHYVEATNPL